MGEYEAREVMARRKLTPDQRRANPPYQPTGPGYIDPADLLDIRKMPGFTGQQGPVPLLGLRPSSAWSERRRGLLDQP
jgi:hypothetical protein